MRTVALQEIVDLPLPGIGAPTSFQFSGDTLYWLAAQRGSLVQSLWALDLRGGEPRQIAGGASDEAGLSHEERLRRERLRERALGVTRYQLTGGRLLFPIGQTWWVGEANGEGLRARLDGGALDVQLSPDGRRVAFVRDDELYVADVDREGERQLTFGARGTGKVHGRAEYIAQEEMHRYEGFWWSGDGRFLAFTRVDETMIPVWRIVHQGSDAPRWEDHRYPFAGTQNADVELYVVSVDGGPPVRMDLGPREHAEYLARVAFLPDGDLVAQIQDRRQQRLELRHLDAATGAGRTLRVETSATFTELHDLFHPLHSSPGAYLWGTEASGYMHLVRVDADGATTPLTEGEWVVDGLYAVDERRGLAWVLGSKDGATERHLYEVSLRGGAPRRLTQAAGWHSVAVDLRGGRFVDARSALDTPPTVSVCALHDGAEQRALYAPSDRRTTGLAPPEPFTVAGPSGDALHGLFFRPDGDGPWPTVVFVYGGPHAQRVMNAWDATVDMRAQHLRSRGVAVMRLDNRGAARRGRVFVDPLYRETGRVEIEDQAHAVRALAERGWVDLGRVGITGWSYGGYLTLKALLNEPDLFRVGVAGAPVTHWDGYDTHYTERYMGLPAENPDGYDRSSALHVEGLRGALMIVHGMLDENVHFRHTGRLVNALVAAGKEFTLQVFPDERHMPRKASDRLYMEHRIVEFLIRHLT